MKDFTILIGSTYYIFTDRVTNEMQSSMNGLWGTLLTRGLSLNEDDAASF